MTRGRHPDLGRTIAEPVANRRGKVLMIEPGPDVLPDLVIVAPGSMTVVTIQKVKRLTLSVQDLEAEFADLICEIRQLPHGGPVTRECWYYNRRGKLRFFRIDDTAIVELAADGTPLPAGTVVTEKPAEQSAGTAVSPVMYPGEGPRGVSPGSTP